MTVARVALAVGAVRWWVQLQGAVVPTAVLKAARRVRREQTVLRPEKNVGFTQYYNYTRQRSTRDNTVHAIVHGTQTYWW